MNLMQKFWPPHRTGIMSSNIEAKFGMSQVLRNGKTLAIFCNEVSADLNLVQEEWQTSCSGEEGSYAVKHGAPLQCKCLAQHFWVGNMFPCTSRMDSCRRPDASRECCCRTRSIHARGTSWTS